MDTKKRKTLKALDSLKDLVTRIKTKIKKKPFTDEEYKIAEEYIIKDTNMIEMEKELLLRGAKFKQARRVIAASNKLRKMSNLPTISIHKPKGGILDDGVRGSKKDLR